MYNRNINRLTAVIQSPIAPRSTNVLWDDLVSNTLKVYRKGIWTVIGGAGGGGEGSSLYWGYDEVQGVIFPLDQRSVQINGDLTVNGTIKTFGLEINGKPFEQYWELDSNTNTLSTTYQVLIKNSLIVEQDTSSGGEGEDTPSGGISGVKVNGVTYYDDNGDGIVDLGTISGGGGTADLSNYYTKAESDARYLALSGGTITAPNKEEPLTLDSAMAQVRLLIQQIGVSKATLGWHSSFGTWMYDHTTGCSMGIRDTNGMPFYYDTAFRELIHSGNIGSQSVASAKSLVASDGTTYVSYNATYGQVLVKGINIGYGGNTIETANGGVLNIQSNSTGGTIISQYGGNVLIGTATDNGAKLQVAGHIDSFNDGDYSGAIGLNRKSAIGGMYNASYAGWQIHNHLGTIGFFCEPLSGSPGERMVITANGYVGIGTDSPSYKLDVNGDSRINGNLIVSGDTSSGSDIRFKDVIKNKTLKIEHIAKAPLFTFKWNDREDDSIHLGSSAQYWEKVTPWLVKGEDFKTLDYSTLGVAMGISLAKKAVNHEERIKELEKEIKRLKEEMIHG